MWTMIGRIIPCIGSNTSVAVSAGRHLGVLNSQSAVMGSIPNAVVLDDLNLLSNIGLTSIVTQ